MIKALDIWLPAWLRRNRQPVQSGLGVRHVMIAVCDHFEPLHGVGVAEAGARIQTWKDGFSSIVKEFCDADGEPPKHTFFYPIEQYDEGLVEGIADLCHSSG